MYIIHIQLKIFIMYFLSKSKENGYTTWYFKKKLLWFITVNFFTLETS